MGRPWKRMRSASIHAIYQFGRWSVIARGLRISPSSSTGRTGLARRHGIFRIPAILRATYACTVHPAGIAYWSCSIVLADRHLTVLVNSGKAIEAVDGKALA